MRSGILATNFDYTYYVNLQNALLSDKIGHLSEEICHFLGLIGIFFIFKGINS